ncbi:MAG: hypothetical protein E7516_10195 [Ruminococcaceae bacterium]|nr:hypothetical protein [Oscillospiraceae bacterium]
MSVKRRKFIRTVSYLVAVCVVIAATGYASFRAKATYEAKLERLRFESLTSLCEYMHEISGGLSLLSVSAGESVAETAYYVSSRALGAKGCTLCFEPARIENINTFIEYVYDFSESYSAGEDKRKKASELSDYAEEIYYHLSDLSVAVMNGEYRMREYGSIYTAEEKAYFEDLLDYSDGRENELFTSSVSAEYGGKFLWGKHTVTLEQARNEAERLTGTLAVLWRSEDGDGEAYSLYHSDTSALISRQGGMLIKLINPVDSGEKVLNESDIVSKAKEFAVMCGYGTLTVFDTDLQTFTARVVLVPEVNGVLLLTSAVTAEVCLSSGRITYFDGENYIKNYRTDIYGGTVPDISFLLPHGASLEKSFLCLADVDGRERLCIYARCTVNGKKVEYYIDCNSYKVIKTEIKK